MKRFTWFLLSLMLAMLMVSCGGPQGQTLKFAFLTDTHIGTAIGANDLRNSVADINTQPDIEFVVVAGDMTEFDFEGELDTVKAILDRLNVPYHVIPGNHELKWSASGGEKFKKLYGDDKFNVSYKGYRFIGVNQGPLMRMGEGFIAREDLNWVEEQLKKMWPRRRQPVFFITHYPIDHTVTNSYDFLEIIKQYNAQAIMHGHGHRNRLNDYSDIPGIMGRSNLSRGGPGGYNIVTIEDNRMIWEERQPVEKKTLDPWLELEIKENVYTDSHYSLKPDMSVNKEYPDVKKVWSYDSQFSITAAAAVVDDLVIFGNRSGKVYALSLENGTPAWTFESGGPVFTEPEVAGTHVYITSTDSLLYCLDYRTGEKIWSYKTKAPIVAHPVFYDDKIYFGSSDGRFRSLDAATGKLVWDFMRIETYVESKPLIAEDKIIFGAWDTYLYALDAQNGKLVWRWRGDNTGRLYSPAVVHPVYASGKVFIVAPDRVMTAIDINNGKTIWRSDTFRVRENIGISEDASTVYAKTMWDNVCAISTKENKPVTKWSNHVGYGFEIDPSYPVEHRGVLYFTTQFGFVYSLNAETGELRWIHRIGGNLLNTPVIHGNTAVITGMDGVVAKIAF